MEIDPIVQYVSGTFDAVEVMRPSDGPGAGDVFFIHAKDAKQFPFATIVTKNYVGFDEQSRLDRPGVYRLNVGVSRDTFRRLFPDTREHDYAASDVLMPHPTYASQSWVSVVNPSEERFEEVKPLLAEAYALALRRVS